MEEDQVLDAGEVKGFTIRCKGDNNVYEDVVVSDADAQVMANNCEYFQNVFAHGTREAEERVILKPDWASSTVKQLVQLLTTGKTHAHSCERESFYLLEEAAQQILLNISLRAPAFVAKGRHTCIFNRAQSDSLFNVTEQLNGPKVEVEFPPYFVSWIGNGNKPISIDDWLALLNQGIAIKRKDDSVSFFRVVLETSPAYGMMPPPQQLTTAQRAKKKMALRITDKHGNAIDITTGKPIRAVAEAKRYQLQARRSTTSIGTILKTMCRILQQYSTGSFGFRASYAQDEFSLCFSCTCTNFAETAKSLSRRGLKVKLHQGNRHEYFLDGSSSFSTCPTITGTLHQIQAVLSVIPEEIHTLSGSAGKSLSNRCQCSLRGCALRVETLDRLVRAVGACQDNPDTLGVDVRSEAFFAVKSVNDMKLLLAAMINGGSGGEDVAVKVPTLFILEQPKGVF